MSEPKAVAKFIELTKIAESVGLTVTSNKTDEAFIIKDAPNSKNPLLFPTLGALDCFLFGYTLAYNIEAKGDESE